jgi:hypothetical protein
MDSRSRPGGAATGRGNDNDDGTPEGYTLDGVVALLSMLDCQPVIPPTDTSWAARVQRDIDSAITRLYLTGCALRDPVENCAVCAAFPYGPGGVTPTSRRPAGIRNSSPRASVTPGGIEPAGLCWAETCDRTDTRLYLPGPACPEHTPAKLAGRREPGATADPSWMERSQPTPSHVDPYRLPRKARRR